MHPNKFGIHLLFCFSRLLKQSVMHLVIVLELLFKKVSIKACFSCGMSLHSAYAFLGLFLAMLAFSYAMAKFIMATDELYPLQFVVEQ